MKTDTSFKGTTKQEVLDALADINARTMFNPDAGVNQKLDLIVKILANMLDKSQNV